MSLQQFCMKLVHAYFYCQVLFQEINHWAILKAYFAQMLLWDIGLKWGKKKIKPLTGSGIMQKAGFISKDPAAINAFVFEMWKNLYYNMISSLLFHFVPLYVLGGGGVRCFFGVFCLFGFFCLFNHMDWCTGEMWILVVDDGVASLKV